MCLMLSLSFSYLGGRYLREKKSPWIKRHISLPYLPTISHRLRYFQLGFAIYFHLSFFIFSFEPILYSLIVIRVRMLFDDVLTTPEFI